MWVKQLLKSKTAMVVGGVILFIIIPGSIIALAIPFLAKAKLLFFK